MYIPRGIRGASLSRSKLPVRHTTSVQPEKQIKETMKPFAKSIKNEWFEVDLHMAKPRLDEQLELYENNKKGIDLF